MFTLITNINQQFFKGYYNSIETHLLLTQLAYGIYISPFHVYPIHLIMSSSNIICHDSWGTALDWNINALECMYLLKYLFGNEYVDIIIGSHASQEWEFC